LLLLLLLLPQTEWLQQQMPPLPQDHQLHHRCAQVMVVRLLLQEVVLQ
jgi:hypothetical protein